MAKILVVDDEIKIREIIKEYAEFEGYEVAQAEDGMQAVEMVKNQDFDIIIMDVMMPKLDGYSACKEIRKIKQIPVCCGGREEHGSSVCRRHRVHSGMGGTVAF